MISQAQAELEAQDVLAVLDRLVINVRLNNEAETYSPLRLCFCLIFFMENMFLFHFVVFQPLNITSNIIGIRFKTTTTLN